MRAVVFVDRAGQALRPLTEWTCAGLLPVLGKPLVVHTLEALASAGVRDVVVVLGPHADQVRRDVGSGARWGLSVEYVLRTADESPDAVVTRLGGGADEVLVVRGDVFRSGMLSAFLAAAAEVPGPSVAATIGGVPAGVRLVRDVGTGALGVLDDPEDRDRWREPGRTVEVAGAALSLVDSLVAYHRTNLEAAAGDFPGITMPGRLVAVGMSVGRQSQVDGNAVKDVPLFVGSRCQVKAGAELLGDVVLSEDVVVDRGATLRRAVILPHTYVGELVEVCDAIVWRNLLIHVDTGATTYVTDSFLLADLHMSSLGAPIVDALNRTLGLLLLALSTPLWPVALIATLTSGVRWPLRRVRLRSNRTEIGRGGVPRRVEFEAFEMATSVPVLRHLPKLLAVVGGHLRLVGVEPMRAMSAPQCDDEHDGLRDDAPAGLLAPAILAASDDASEEDRRATDARYAAARTALDDARLALMAARALLTRRAWSPSAAATETTGAEARDAVDGPSARR